MLYTNKNAPVYPHDRFLDAILIRFFPRWVLPNHVTILRFCLVPVVLWYVVHQDWAVAVPLFLFAAFTDALDGSIARLRRQITMWGTFADPAADKLLIGSVALVLIAGGLDAKLAIALVCTELAILTAGAIRYHGKLRVSANWAGKTKMLLQVAGVALLLIAQWTAIPLIAGLAGLVIIAAIIAAVVSLLTYSL